MKKYLLFTLCFILLKAFPLSAQLEGGFKDADASNKLRAIDFQEQFISDAIEYKGAILAFGKGTIYQYDPTDESIQILVEGIEGNSGEFVGIYEIGAKPVLIYNVFNENRDFVSSAYTPIGSSNHFKIGNKGEIKLFIPEGQGYYIEDTGSANILSTGGIFETEFKQIREIYAFPQFKFGAITSKVLFFVDYKTSDLKTPILYKINMGEEGGLATPNGVTELFSHDLTIFNDAAIFVNSAKDLTYATGEKGETVKVIEAGLGVKNLFTFGNDLLCTFFPEELQLFIFDSNLEFLRKVTFENNPNFLKEGLRNVIPFNNELVALESPQNGVALLTNKFDIINGGGIPVLEYPLKEVSLKGKFALFYTRGVSELIEEIYIWNLDTKKEVDYTKFEVPAIGYSTHNVNAINSDGIYQSAFSKDFGFELYINNGSEKFQVAEEITNTDYEQAVLENLKIEEVFADYSTFPKKLFNFNGTIYSLSHLQMPNSFTNADAQNAGFNTAVRDMNFLYKLNERPGIPSPSSFTVDENMAKGTAIGSLSATDPDDSNLSFQLVNGTGAIDNGKVSVSGNQLVLNEVPDFEADSLWSILAQVSDAHGDKRSRSITININDVNDAPTGLSLTTEFVSESLPLGSPIAGIETVDEDATDTFTYSLSASNSDPGVADADNGSFTVTDSVLISNTTFDSAIKSEYFITLSVSDQGGETYQQAFVINITEENEAPTNILLDNNTIEENLTGRTLVGTLDTEDADSEEDNDDTDDVDFTYALVAGSGDDDNSSFEISADSLYAISSFNFEEVESLSVRVQTKDPKMATFNKAFTINVIDANDAPAAILFSNDSIDENQGSGTVVGTLDGQDPDASDEFDFIFIEDDNFPDNTAFSVNTNNELVQDVENFDYESKSLYEIKLRLTDKGGESIDSVLAIHIGDINDEPSDITLSGTSVNEETNNAVAGQLNVVDEDATDNHSFSLPADSLSNHRFQILTGDELALASPLNYEQDDLSYEVYIEVTDISGAKFGKVFEIDLLDINDAVDTLVIKRTIIKSGLAFEEKVSNIELRDEDLGDNISNFYSRDDYTMTLIDSENFPDNSNFQVIYQNDDQVYALEAATDLTFTEEGDNLYQINIEVLNGETTYSQSFEIELVSESTNTPPTEINISNDSITSVATVGTEVGVLSSVDDSGDTHVYSLISNTSSNDNELFSISSDRLILEANLRDSTEQSYIVAVKSEDNGGLSLQEEIKIYVKEFEDSTPPLIAGITGGDISVDENQSTFDLSGSVTDNAFLESVQLEYGPVTSVEFTKNDMIELEGGQFTSNIPADQGDAFGLKARIVAVDTSGNSAASDTVYFYRSVSSSGALANLPTERIGVGKTSRDYRMFSVPYNLQSENSSLRDIFETSLGQTYSESNFKVFHWNPEREAYDEFLSIGNVESGESYWLTTVIEEPSINFGAGNVFPYKTSNKARWNLKAGWNQIGNPYPISIDWEVIQANNPEVGDLYVFDEEGFVTATTLAPHQGAFVLVQENMSVEADVTNNSALRSTAVTERSESSVELILNLVQGELRAKGGVAMHETAKDGLDSWDKANPPALGEHVEISFKQIESVWDNYRWDVVKTKDYHVWDFTVNTSKEDQFNSLSWNADEFLNGQFYLVDMETLQKIDITEKSEYQFRGKKAYHFKLVFDRYATDRFDLGALLIGSPYPNPFNSRLNVPVNISDVQNAQATIQILDLSGRLLAEKSWTSELREGYQLLNFDQVDQTTRDGSSLSTGIYIYKLKVTQRNGTERKTGRIIKH
ncbi:cadherin domain-containing protein [Marivirga sp.]|uniref:cadherin domain-containing protein n=1 Tax=Marivirga sp. TaxID=2018662 RepID=UPI003DA754B5